MKWHACHENKNLTRLLRQHRVSVGTRFDRERLLDEASKCLRTTTSEATRTCARVPNSKAIICGAPRLRRSKICSENSSKLTTFWSHLVASYEELMVNEVLSVVWIWRNRQRRRLWRKRSSVRFPAQRMAIHVNHMRKAFGWLHLSSFWHWTQVEPILNELSKMS